MGRVEIAESLSQTICTTIIGTMLGYFAKSYLETKAEKNLEFEKEKFNMETNTVSSDDEAVG